MQRKFQISGWLKRRKIRLRGNPNLPTIPSLLREVLVPLAVLLAWGQFGGIRAQGYYPVQNFSSTDYNARRKNWDISQDSRGSIYVANNGGLLQFNGSSWNLYPSPNGSELLSVLCHGDRVYTGCYRELGYWQSDTLGRLSYTSLLPGLRQPLMEEEEVRNIEVVGDYIVFQTQQHLIFYKEGEEENLHVREIRNELPKLFTWDDRLFYQKAGSGIWEIKQGNERMIAYGPGISDNRVVGFFQTDEGWLAVNEDARFIRGEEGAEGSYFPLPSAYKLRGLKVYSAMRGRSGNYFLGTIGSGLVTLDKEGGWVQRQDRSTGLFNNTVLSISEDTSGRIWLGLDHGISVIFPGSPFREWADNAGRLGVIHTALKRNDTLFVGSNQGLFYRPGGATAEFTFVENSEGQVWNLYEYDGVLFCGHHNGTYTLKGTRLIQLSSFPGVWGFRPVPGRTDLLLQGSYQGLSILEKAPNGWTFRNRMSGFSISSRFVEWDGDGRLLINHERKGSFLLEADDDFRRLRVLKTWEAKSDASSLITHRGQVIYGYRSGVDRYDPESREWKPYPEVRQLVSQSGDSLNSILLNNSRQEEFWGFGDRTLFRFSPNLLNGALELESYPISRDLRTQIGREGFECLVEVEPGAYLIGLSEGFLIFRPSESRPVQHEVFLTRGVLNPDSPEERALRPGTWESVIEFGKGSIRLDLGVSELNKFQEVFYRYTLNGEQLTPEEWTPDPTLFLSSLPSGKHQLGVRSRIGATLSSNELSFDIRVIPPWYARTWAWLIYALLAAGIFYTLHLMYRRHYKRESERQELRNRQIREQEKLEAEQKIAHIELEKMQQEVDSKNRELGASTLSLIRKNEILNRIKQMLLKIESRKTEPILDLIDRNLRDEDDWKSFEEAFNNADKDFLKRIKEIHSDLTPHDLRICAYLRLNLSSKEIAPLLNISVKSVEVKRYRLRKKLGLNPKQGLIDYILQL